MNNRPEDEDPDDAYWRHEGKKHADFIEHNTPRPGQKWAPADFMYDTPGSKKE